MTVGMRGAGEVVKNLFLVCYEGTLFWGGRGVVVKGLAFLLINRSNENHS